jgi:hypothetical protein
VLTLLGPGRESLLGSVQPVHRVCPGEQVERGESALRLVELGLRQGGLPAMGRDEAGQCVPATDLKRRCAELGRPREDRRVVVEHRDQLQGFDLDDLADASAGDVQRLLGEPAGHAPLPSLR